MENINVDDLQPGMKFADALTAWKSVPLATQVKVLNMLAFAHDIPVDEKHVLLRLSKMIETWRDADPVAYVIAMRLLEAANSVTP